MPKIGLEDWTPRERRAAATLAGAWLVGAAAGWFGFVATIERAASAVLHPPRPTLAELVARVGPDDPRAAWYAAALALAAEEAVATSAPRPLDPNGAGRAEWDRLPGIGPVTAIAVVRHREMHGPFQGEADLLAVRGIGPKTLERLRPWLRWGRGLADRRGTYSDLSGGARLPDLNQVDAEFLRALPGFGPELAIRVVRERQARGAFREWNELLSIEGIGSARLEILQNATRLRAR